jgi:hypothetical protein
MSQLSIYLPAFSGDYSGVCSALFDLNCVVIIDDAMCCTRTYVSYDEPRWTDTRKSTFCAGLRTMDAILGNDRKLIGQTLDVIQDIKPDFVALLGSPVPAIIGTDMIGMAKEIETQSGYPALGFDTTGFSYYNRGISSAMITLLKKFAPCKLETVTNSVNILGLTPLDFSANDNCNDFQKLLSDNGLKLNSSFMMNTDLQQIYNAPAASVNLVVSESGFSTALYMEKQFGIPYVVATPIGQHFSRIILQAIENTIKDKKNRILSGYKNKREFPSLLIVGDQVIANSLRAAIQLINKEANITVASFFDIQYELALQGDVFLKSERHLIELLQSGKFDRLLADPLINQLPAAQSLKCYPFPHPAISSYLYWDKVPLFMGNFIEEMLSFYAIQNV